MKEQNTGILARIDARLLDSDRDALMAAKAEINRLTRLVEPPPNPTSDEPATPGELALMATIARRKMGISTLENRGSDSLDFHDLSVGSVSDGLFLAYRAGQGQPVERLPEPDREAYETQFTEEIVAEIETIAAIHTRQRVEYLFANPAEWHRVSGSELLDMMRHAWRLGWDSRHTAENTWAQTPTAQTSETPQE
jgi:hypothetical protein